MNENKFLKKVNESAMKELLIWLEEFNSSGYKQIIDPVGVVQGNVLSGRYLRQLLFSGQFDFFEILESDGKDICGVLIVTKNEVIKLRAASLVLFAINSNADISNCCVYSSNPLHVLSIALNTEGYEAAGFKNVAKIKGSLNSLNYMYLSLNAGKTK